PLGGAIGATLGRGLDREIIGNGRREGPRLTELAVSTSSYGQPIPGLYGRVRVPGSVIWASDLAERRETSGGGKGRPKTTSYSYSVSLAVALSSRPIERVGRIWADGHLLRGAAGDLKTGGSLRVHRGHADQPPDPLLVAELGARCPAFRGCAYVVFEDLALEDFGNRVPALSFEVLAGSATGVAGEIARTHGFDAVTAPIAELEGYSHDGGSAAATLTHLARLTPLGVRWTPDGPQLASVDLESEAPITLSDPVVTPEGDFGRMAGIERTRATLVEPISALRYYDSARSYQPGLQRAPGEAGGGAVLELPGVLNATNARALLSRTRLRERRQSETLSLRIAALDPKVGPGSIVRVPDHPGLWQVTAWEWREIGIELDLQRHATATPVTAAADSGAAWDPPDRQAVGSLLRAFELPWDGTGPDGQPQRFAAIGAPDGRWAGAALQPCNLGRYAEAAFPTEQGYVGFYGWKQRRQGQLTGRQRSQ
ncbi:MAG: phage tail protein, partial [Pseudomonadota bacterium]|nr:phage tail protein [Pseudomonadota bacterium]